MPMNYTGPMPLSPTLKLRADEDIILLQQQECLTPINNPDAAYLSSTTKIDISGIPDLTVLTSITNGVQTVTFDVPVIKASVPATFSLWSSPPQSESATPPVLFANTDMLTLTLSVPSSVVGFELEPNNMNTFTFSASFFSGSTLLGTITRNPSGNAGALLYAGRTCGPCIDRVVITGPAEAQGFAIAQFRYIPCPPPTRGVKLNDCDIA